MKLLALAFGLMLSISAAAHATHTDDYGFPIENAAQSDDYGFPTEYATHTDDYGFPIED